MSPSDPTAWVVHKFGGSSVADAECFRRVANILDELPPGPLGVVLSACRGVTDALLNLVTRAEAQDDAYRGDLDAIRMRHATIADAVLSADAAKLYMAGFDRDRHDIEGILHTVKLTRSAANNVRDLIAGYGEIWSTKLFREAYAEKN
jgi:aspartokinase/homoserine dehydrogenase 1